MKKVIGKILNVLFFATGFFVIFSRDVFAYIDPSVTTYLVQAIAGVIIALGACLTIFRHKIASLFKKNKDEAKREIHIKEDEEAASETSSEEGTN